MLTVQDECRMRAESATWHDELAWAVRNGEHMDLPTPDTGG